MSSFNPLSCLYTTLFNTYGLSLSQSLCSCCLITTWKCVSLVDLLDSLLWAGGNGLPSTSDISHLGCNYSCIPVTVFFPLGVRLGLNNYKKIKYEHLLLLTVNNIKILNKKLDRCTYEDILNLTLLPFSLCFIIWNEDVISWYSLSITIWIASFLCLVAEQISRGVGIK